MVASIYLDYAATTPVDQRVIERMVAHMSVDADFGNPASRSHAYGWQAEESVE
ncbi:MAG: IscS subfamily cysteine desulfurase, partial [Pseudomonadota bacterium]|nr:IscS subfamily cysteine desulfurase [Pseudomonadota bacterium]MEC8047868.1 IscS subfamily cysteine desulfurase [Pseudomonadota bacterium]MEC8072441.1 IscS subfamily cysteine desulfurase [Pseudomonadota bacterium]MEC8481541.1 IscS subfamily cysteine desulfurase [Pseudomonadota bacterium]MEC8696945.1 IscS subfamily cysteine desulfurase [Pseudomonadota bacterium]